MARYMLGVPVSMVFGYFVAGWVNQLYGWRVTFVVLGAPGLVLAAVAWFTLREPRVAGGSRAQDHVAAESAPSLAVGAASVLMKQGVKIPEEISIVGFGNILLCEHFSIPLTTVHLPKFRVGSALMESMRHLLKREAVETKRLPTDLLIRKSTAPPKKSAHP